LTPDDEEIRMNHLRTRPAVAAIALLAALVASLATARYADAGEYRAVQCHPGLGAKHGDAHFQSNSPRYVGRAACSDVGLTITHEAGRKPTRAGRYGAWQLNAPAGTEIVQARAQVRAAGQGGHAPQMSVALKNGARRQLSNVRGDRHAVLWRGGGEGQALIARLACAGRSECGPGRGAYIHLRRIALVLRDLWAPQLELGGELVARGSRRGRRELTVSASDSGSGVRTVTVNVNGRPLVARTLDCALNGRIGLRLRPCPASTTVSFAVHTREGFRQGPNRMRVCASDLARDSRANRRCAVRTVRVDNACPVAGAPGARLEAHFRGGKRRERVRADRPAFVTGRVLDERGEPVAGTVVCVAARPRAPRAAERVIATPRTDSRGRFEARIAPGASREIRVAHWPDGDRALERYLTLRSRARPKLRIAPERTLTNGERVRFRVRLAGPARGGRLVEIRARARGRWVRVKGGRTNGRGVWRGSYRFRSTTGHRTYEFRAHVPRQPRYPFDPGHSRVARVRVVG
jgi:hypothetical protein